MALLKIDSVLVPEEVYVDLRNSKRYIKKALVVSRYENILFGMSPLMQKAINTITFLDLKFVKGTITYHHYFSDVFPNFFSSYQIRQRLIRKDLFKDLVGIVSSNKTNIIVNKRSEEEISNNQRVILTNYEELDEELISTQYWNRVQLLKSYEVEVK